MYARLEWREMVNAVEARGGKNQISYRIIIRCEKKKKINMYTKSGKKKGMKKEKRKKSLIVYFKHMQT